MRVLYVASKYDYGDMSRGYSFEHYNLFDTLVNMGHDIIYFDLTALGQRHGRDRMNEMLVEIARNEKADLMFTCLNVDELKAEAIRKVTDSTDTVTFNWFCDDHWRFDSYSKLMAPAFDYVSTTARSAVPKYEKIGYKNAIKTQWAANPFLYRKLDLPLAYDVTFIGQPHGDRREVIQGIRDRGIAVKAWGHGWESGRISQDDMIRVFNQSRINLNLSNASMPTRPLWEKAVNKAYRTLLSAAAVLDRRITVRNLVRIRYDPQIKGRNFEVPGCGGFMLTGQADDLESYYRPGKEIVLFGDAKEMIGHIQYYLANEDERKAVADAGYARTMREHTYVHRFNEIFRRMGLPTAAADSILGGGVKPGSVREIE